MGEPREVVVGQGTGCLSSGSFSFDEVEPAVQWRVEHQVDISQWHGSRVQAHLGFRGHDMNHLGPGRDRRPSAPAAGEHDRQQPDERSHGSSASQSLASNTIHETMYPSDILGETLIDAQETEVLLEPFRACKLLCKSA